MKFRREGMLSEHHIVSPSFNYSTENPYNVINSLTNIIKDQSTDNVPNIIVGTSLGAFYAYILSVMTDSVAILINPSLIPFVTLTKNNRLDFNLAKKYSELFGIYMYGIELPNVEVIVGDSDEVINHENITKNLIPCKTFYYIKNGKHQLEINTELELIFKGLLIKQW
jgi:predicted esterase YcpF (UPF0227 family)